METAAPARETPETQHAHDPADRLIVALDYPSADAAMNLVDQLQGTCRWFKVGMELYYAVGNSVIHRLLDRNCRIFLDLKLHDIPNTVAAAIRSVAELGASLLTVHAAGGDQMMRAAALAAASPKAPRLLAVTVLTSMDAAELAGVGILDKQEPRGAVQSQVLRLARLAQVAGINGLVCSAEEVAAVREVMGPKAQLVVPGIRPAAVQTPGSAQTKDDQRRVATPAAAIARGASMLVVGRPITQATDPAAAATAILAEIQAAG